MNVYMTNGTLAFLRKLAEKHTNIHFYFMENESSILAYYEGVKKRIFAAGREFESLESSGNINEYGFVMMDHIPVQSESQPVFENSFLNIKQSIVQAQGFQAVRLLKPKKGNTYIILSQWTTRSNYEDWSEQASEITIKSPAYFADKRFRVGYQMVVEDDNS